MTAPATERVQAAQRLAAEATRIADAAIERGKELLDRGRGIDERQPHAERLAQVATEARAAHELAGYASRVPPSAPDAALEADLAHAFAAEILHAIAGRVRAHPDEFGGAGLLAPLDDPDLAQALRSGLDDAFVEDIGRRVIEARGVNQCWLEDPAAGMVRESARAFAKAEIAPIAQEMHRQDLDVPESLIRHMAEVGFFGISIPEEYGGTGMSATAMTILSEELCAASLVGGSLITRSEILTRALLQGGTEEQKRTWLPRIASGELMVGVAVTEPDVGSDVASLQCRATPGQLDGREGWFIDGPKAWSTFAGRANILALLARTDPNPASGARGLSLFIVEKDPHPGHHFVQTQPGGGQIVGTANPTPGYRGMHSFTLAFDRYFVPAENLVGGEAGLNRGFFLQMSGFAVGRLQTGGRATGVAQAALEKACAYVTARTQFGRPIGEYGLTRYKIGRMAAHVMAGRQLTYAAARLVDQGDVRVEPAMAKLFASDVAVWATQDAQLLHGGWGYSEEDPIARYVADAQVLPIFEGVKPILELKVIARSLLADSA